MTTPLGRVAVLLFRDVRSGFGLVVVGLLLALAGAVILTWLSPSKTIATATATLAASAIFFGVNVFFELRSQPPQSLEFSVAFTIDKAVPVVSSEDRGSGLTLYESEANTFLVRDRPEMFSQGARLVQDLAVAEALRFVAVELLDWQLEVKRFKGGGVLQETRTPRSPDHDCTWFDQASIRKLLTDAKNTFAEIPIHIPGARACLPPNSVVTLENAEIVIRNPFETVRIRTILSSGTSCAKPRSNGQVPVLPDGTTPQYERRTVNVNVSIAPTGLYSQHRDSPKHIAWRARILNEMPTSFSQP